METTVKRSEKWLAHFNFQVDWCRRNIDGKTENEYQEIAIAMTDTVINEAQADAPQLVKHPIYTHCYEAPGGQLYGLNTEQRHRTWQGDIRVSKDAHTPGKYIARYCTHYFGTPHEYITLIVSVGPEAGTDLRPYNTTETFAESMERLHAYVIANDLLP